MKKLILLLALLVWSNGYAGWLQISTVPTSAVINSITVVNSNVIWVACDGAKVYKSTDGGITWLARNGGLPAGNLYGISALDTSNCWVGTVNGSIYKTGNGGINWVLQFSQTGSFSNGVKMFSPTYGVYYGDPTGAGQPYQLRYTTNGGTNWLLSPSAPIAGNEFGVINAWDWTDTSHFWVGSANITANATSANIYRISSGYQTGGWSATSVTGNGGSAGLYYQAIGMYDQNNGLAGSNGSNVRKTNNGGSTWVVAPNPPGVTSFAAINMNGLKDGSRTIRISVNTTNGNFCFRTNDLGGYYFAEAIPAIATTNGLQHMQFLNSGLGYAGGNAGIFLKYTSITVLAKMIIEGFYDANTNVMSQTDTVRAYLRNSTSPYAAVDSARSAVDSATYGGTYNFDNAGSGTYYLQLIHRNALETWSKTGGEAYSPGNTYSYDFTTASSQAYGNNMPQVDASPVRFALYSGDVNRDGTVDLSDIVAVFNDASIFNSGYIVTDINGDGFADLSDIVITFNNSSLFVSVVRP